MTIDTSNASQCERGEGGGPWRFGSTRINAGTVEFALHHRNIDGGKSGASNPDQGVCIQVMAEVNGRETELLRFDCFDVGCRTTTTAPKRRTSGTTWT